MCIFKSISYCGGPWLVCTDGNRCPTVPGEGTPSSGRRAPILSPCPHNLSPSDLHLVWSGYCFLSIFSPFFLSVFAHVCPTQVFSYLLSLFFQNPRHNVALSSHLSHLCSVHKFHENLPKFSLWFTCVFSPVEVFKLREVSTLPFWNSLILSHAGLCMMFSFITEGIVLIVAVCPTLCSLLGI